MDYKEIKDADNEEQSFLESSRRRLPQLIEGSSVHGLSHAVFATRVGAKVFWTLLMVAGASGLMTNLVFVVQQYMKDPTFTYTVENNDFKWPDITLCNPGSPIPFYGNKRLLTKWKNLSRQLQLLRSSNDGLQNFSKNKILLSTVNHKEFLMDLPSNFIEEKDIQRRNPWPENTTVTKSIWFANGVCQSFNFDNRSSQSDNPATRATVKIWLKFYNYKIFDSERNPHALLMYITPPNGSIFGFDPNIILTGRDVYVEIFLTHVKRISRHSKCRKDYLRTEVYDASLTRSYIINGGYVDCLVISMQNNSLNQCKCYNPKYPIHVTKQVPPRLCFNMTLYNASQMQENYNCLESVFKNAPPYPKHCDHFKKKPCDEWIYNVKQREVPYVNETISRSIKKFMSDKLKGLTPHYPTKDWFTFLRDNFIEINFITEHDFVTHMHEEYSYPFSNFLSDIGGLLGLWIGLSVVGLFELLEIMGLALLLLGKKLHERLSS